MKSVFKLQGPNFECEKYTYVPEALYHRKTAVINSDLFVFGGYLQNGEYDNCVRKFCNKTKTWNCKWQSNIDFGTYIICSFKTKYLPYKNRRFVFCLHF